MRGCDRRRRRRCARVKPTGGADADAGADRVGVCSPPVELCSTAAQRRGVARGECLRGRRAARRWWWWWWRRRRLCVCHCRPPTHPPPPPPPYSPPRRPAAPATPSPTSRHRRPAGMDRGAGGITGAAGEWRADRLVVFWGVATGTGWCRRRGCAGCRFAVRGARIALLSAARRSRRRRCGCRPPTHARPQWTSRSWRCTRVYVCTPFPENRQLLTAAGHGGGWDCRERDCGTVGTVGLRQRDFRRAAQPRRDVFVFDAHLSRRSVLCASLSDGTCVSWTSPGVPAWRC